MSKTIAACALTALTGCFEGISRDAAVNLHPDARLQITVYDKDNRAIRSHVYTTDERGRVFELDMEWAHGEDPNK